jgi:hypothetical protein
VGYFDFVGIVALRPETRSQSTKAHQITNTRSRRMALSVVGFTNKNTGVRISSSPPRTIFQLYLCEFTPPLFPLSNARRLPREQPNPQRQSRALYYTAFLASMEWTFSSGVF